MKALEQQQQDLVIVSMSDLSRNAMNRVWQKAKLIVTQTADQNREGGKSTSTYWTISMFMFMLCWGQLKATLKCAVLSHNTMPQDVSSFEGLSNWHAECRNV
jgi:hypothetical protein